MRKLFAVLKREYLQAVRKKMFIFMTLFFPVLMAGTMGLPMLMMAKGLSGKKVAVIDGTGQLHDAFTKTTTNQKKRRNDIPLDLTIDYVGAQSKDVGETAKPYLGRLSSREADKLDGVLT